MVQLGHQPAGEEARSNTDECDAKTPILANSKVSVPAKLVKYGYTFIANSELHTKMRNKRELNPTWKWVGTMRIPEELLSDQSWVEVTIKSEGERLCGLKTGGLAKTWGLDQCLVTIRLTRLFDIVVRLTKKRDPNLKYDADIRSYNIDMQEGGQTIRRLNRVANRDQEPGMENPPDEITCVKVGNILRVQIPHQMPSDDILEREIRVLESPGQMNEREVCIWWIKNEIAVINRGMVDCEITVSFNQNIWIMEVNDRMINTEKPYALVFIKNYVNNTRWIKQVPWNARCKRARDGEIAKIIPIKPTLKVRSAIITSLTTPSIKTTKQTSTTMTNEQELMKRNVMMSVESLWEHAYHNEWFRWMWFTGKGMISEDCIMCSESPLSVSTVIPEKYTFEKCAKEYRNDCVDLVIWQKPGVKLLPRCGIHCRIVYGYQKTHANWLYEHQQKICEEFGVSTTQSEPPTNYKIDLTEEYECFANGRVYKNPKSVNVGNTTVNCKTTWVLSWFTHAGMEQTVLKTPVWYENPVKLDQTCENMIMAVPDIKMLNEQMQSVADSFWMCGENVLRNSLPVNWVGLCTLVRMRMSVIMFYNNIQDKNEESEKIPTVKRQYTAAHKGRLDAVGNPRGIPDEFKVKNELKAGFESLLPWLKRNKNIKWINHIYYNQQRFINYTIEVASVLGQKPQHNSRMAEQNRQDLDWLLAERSGICKLFGKYCCTVIPNNTESASIFFVAMIGLTEFGYTVSESAGSIYLAWDWLDQTLGEGGALFVKTGISALIILIIVSVLMFCIVPILKKKGQEVLEAHMNMVTDFQMAQTMINNENCLSDQEGGQDIVRE